MSTTFHVFPTNANTPTFREVLELATSHLGAFLHSYAINRRVPLAVVLRSFEPDFSLLPFSIDDPAWWPGDRYAWFHVPGISGGTDAHASPMDDYGRSTIEGVKAKGLPELIDLTSATLRVGRYWSFGRSGGQPPVINVAYGMLAGSLAELTNGWVNSTDGAWDHTRLPARAGVFLSTYFRPESSPAWANCDWARRCINRLREEGSDAQVNE